MIKEKQGAIYDSIPCLSSCPKASEHHCTFSFMPAKPMRTFTRARILLKADEGWTDQQICAAFDVSRNTSI